MQKKNTLFHICSVLCCASMVSHVNEVPADSLMVAPAGVSAASRNSTSSIERGSHLRDHGSGAWDPSTLLAPQRWLARRTPSQLKHHSWCRLSPMTCASGSSRSHKAQRSSTFRSWTSRTVSSSTRRGWRTWLQVR